MGSDLDRPDGTAAAVPSGGLARLGDGPLLPNPQWVITGARLPGGRCRVVASNTLIAAQVANADSPGEPDVAMWPAGAGFRFVMNRQLRLTALIGSGFYLVDGDSYAACLAALFAEWAPATTGRPELTGG